jgi:hypothetical protein
MSERRSNARSVRNSSHPRPLWNNTPNHTASKLELVGNRLNKRDKGGGAAVKVAQDCALAKYSNKICLDNDCNKLLFVSKQGGEFQSQIINR